MRSRKDSPGLAVMRTTMRSESTLVPPVTAERSPPALADDRRGLAGDGRLVDRGDALDDLAVAGDEHARPRPPPGRPCAARGGDASPRAPLTSRRAVVSLRILRSASACALPRPSAMASAKLAKSDREPEPERDRGGEPERRAPAGARTRSRTQSTVVSTLPTSTTNMTGFLATCRGASLRKLSSSGLPRDRRIEERELSCSRSSSEHLSAGARGSARPSGPGTAPGRR